MTRHDDHKLHPLTLLCYSSALVSMMLLPVALIFEPRGLQLAARLAGRDDTFTPLLLGGARAAVVRRAGAVCWPHAPVCFNPRRAVGKAEVGSVRRERPTHGLPALPC
jgi:hypothetical protein